MSFNEIFLRNVIYNNIKSHKNSGPDPFLRKNNSAKTTAGGRRLTPLPSLFRNNWSKKCYVSKIFRIYIRIVYLEQNY